MSSVINRYCSTIHDRKQKISPGELQQLLDSIVLELKKTTNTSTDDCLNIIHALKHISGLILIDAVIINHEIFTFIENVFIHLLKQWPKEKINERLFQEIVDLFAKLIKHLKTSNQNCSVIFQNWFLNPSFFQTIASVLEDISMNSNRYLKENQSMKSFIMLIKSIKSFQKDSEQIRDHPVVLLLVNPIVQCLCSPVYITTLKKLEIKSNKFTSFEEFLLETLPDYCIWNRGKAQFLIIHQLCLNNMLKSYSEIYDLFLPSITDWRYPLLDSIFHLTALLRHVAYYPSTRAYFKDNPKLIDSTLMILNANCLLDNVLLTTDYNSETNLTDSAISLIFNLTQDFQYLTLIEENCFFSKEIFLQLKQAKVDRVRLHAFMILARILNETDIQNLDNIDALVAVLFGYLLAATNDPRHSFEDVPMEHLLVSFKAFAQHDQIKEEILNQNYFQFLIQCATQKNLHVGLVLQISLEIIWTLIFNEKIRLILVEKYDQFLVDLKTISIKSDDPGVQAAAKGILWKLENELTIKYPSNLSDDKYDLMISYSHSNKDLCHQIHQQLIDMKYRVWLDLENMYGSTFQSMAQAIESSDMILICMSNPYKQSAYCRSEAEYAYTRRRHIIPLVMEKKYQPDGWLGFICASKMYVDFTKSDFEQAFEKLMAQIQLYQRQNKIEPVTHPGEIIRKEEVPARKMSGIEYTYPSRYWEWWTHEDVLDFLRDKQLDILRPLFESEQQFDGHSLYLLYQQCQSNLHSTYQLLNTQLSQYHDHVLPYLTFLRFASELEKQSNPISIKQLIRYCLWNIWKTFLRTN